jgi:hypothetical protein
MNFEHGKWSEKWRLLYLRQLRVLEKNQFHLVGMIAWRGSCLYILLEAHEGGHFVLFSDCEGLAVASHILECQVCCYWDYSCLRCWVQDNLKCKFKMLSCQLMENPVLV